jgi:hypothetical protein
MSQYTAGKWPPTNPSSEFDVDVMKFVGQTDFAPRQPQEATTPSTVNGHPEDLQSSNIHPVLFDYMKQFEGKSEKEGDVSVYPAQASTLEFLAEQGLFPPVIPGLAAETDMLRAGDSFGDMDILGSYSESSWPLYNDPLLGSNSLQGRALDTSSQPLRFDGVFLGQRVGPDQVSGQQPQDQQWEQFLSTLMS